MGGSLTPTSDGHESNVYRWVLGYWTIIIKIVLFILGEVVDLEKPAGNGLIDKICCCLGCGRSRQISPPLPLRPKENLSTDESSEYDSYDSYSSTSSESILSGRPKPTKVNFPVSIKRLLRRLE